MTLRILLPFIVVCCLFFACEKKDNAPSICELGELPECEKAEVFTDSDTALIFRVVEYMPRFPGCDSIDRNCADSLMYTFIEENLIYPECAKSKNTEGMVIVQFTVDKAGEIGDCAIVRSVGDGCDHEVLRVMSLFPRFLPGRQRGNPVFVRYTLPVRFEL